MSQNHCRKCGGALRRIHRTLREKLLYYGIFECRNCQERFGRSRQHMYYTGPAARCPLCGTFRLTKLQRPDRIDPMYRHPLTLLQRVFPNKRLFHCRFCRIQFYDRRPPLDELPKEISEALTAEHV